MGRKTDRAFISAQERGIDGYGGFKRARLGLPYQRLPFDCCAISFTPFEDAVCADDGTVMDIVNAVPYIQKHATHPVSGQPLSLDDLTPLTFHRNSDGEYCCPILAKVFTQVRRGSCGAAGRCAALLTRQCAQHSHIVAVKASGNVYSYEAVQQLNVKTKSWRDLLTEEPFTRSDIIHLQARPGL